jgi:hypothetical protein
MHEVAIFIKSYPRDYPWLTHCLRSIRKFVTGQNEVVLVLPEEHPFPVGDERVITRKEWKDLPRPGVPAPGYNYQMFVKLMADQHCPESEAILYVDSDCVFNRPFDVSEMFEGEKLKLLRRRWEDSGDAQCWRAPVEHALGVKTQWETMVAHPMCYWSETIRKTREAVEAKQRQKIEYYIRSRDRFTEFSLLGNYALQNEPDRYHPVENGPSDGYPRPIHQFWSHGGCGPEDIKVIEDILK